MFEIRKNNQWEGVSYEHKTLSPDFMFNYPSPIGVCPFYFEVFLFGDMLILKVQAYISVSYFINLIVVKNRAPNLNLFETEDLIKRENNPISRTDN